MNKLNPKSIMKTGIPMIIAAGVCGLVLTAPSGFSQGSLTPPGAPAPTMKTLQQVEPRTDVLKLSGDASDLFLITNSGSYYLTTNIVGVSGKNGIFITANNVTLDLNGFALLGVPGSVEGIQVSGSLSCTNVTVRNGNVSGWGSGGVSVANSTSYNLVFDRLNLSVNSSSVGINAFNALISGCTVNGGSYGIIAVESDVRDCSINGSANAGILVNYGTVSGCLVQNCVGAGIYVNAPGCQIIGNTCIRNNSSADVNEAGIFINDSNNRVENNHVSASGHAGIQVNNSSYVNNVIIKNTVSGNGPNNYLGTGGNDFGSIGTAATASSPWANISH
jgi:parallel beta-helix repeat protein